MKRTGKIVKRLILLLFVFCIAIAAIFLFTRKDEETEPIYAKTGSAALPVVTMNVEGEQVNALYGYLTKMEPQFTADTITPLPEDRQLCVTVEYLDADLINMEYEIRSLDGSRLVEDTRIRDWESSDGTVTAVLPIQNLLEEGKEYLLTLILTQNSGTEIYYYTRIVLSDDLHTGEMMSFIKDFHDKTMDSSRAQDLVVYMKTTTASRTTLADVSLHSTFSQLTWGDLEPVQTEQSDITIRDINESIGSFLLSFQVQAKNPDNNQMETYQVEEYYCVQYSSTQWYLLVYDRTVSQLFEPEQQVTEEGIDLGIIPADSVQIMESSDGSQIAFVLNGQLWSYLPDDGRLVRVFSFEPEVNEDPRNSRQEHDIQIVAAGDDGSIAFIVYGCMNNGGHEGNVGLAYYDYDGSTGQLTEMLFLPSDVPWQILRESVGTLSYISQSGLFYLLFGSAIYAIDFEGNEIVVVAEEVNTETVAISNNKSMIAWEDGDTIHVMNLDTAEQFTIEAENGELIKTLGFIEKDFICGIAKAADVYSQSESEDVFPMYALEIYNQNGGIETRYEKNGVYISGVSVETGSVRLYRMARGADGSWQELSEDALIQNVSRDDEETSVLTQSVSDYKRTVYAIEAARPKEQAELTVSAPEKIFLSDNELSITTRQSQNGSYYAFAKGKLQGICPTAAEAIQLTYDDIGTVLYQDGTYVLRRGYKVSRRKLTIPIVRAISEEDSLRACLEVILEMSGTDGDVNGQLADGKEPVQILCDLLPGNAHDLTGCTLEQVIYYYLACGYPIVAEVNSGSSAVLITGYDNNSVYLYEPVSGEETAMDFDEAEDWFEWNGNVFIGYLP